MPTSNTKLASLWKRFMSEYSIILIFVAMIIIATILEGETFFTIKNFVNLFRNNTVIGIIAFGMSFVIISGNIDLSVGAQLVATASIVLTVVNKTANIPLAIIAGVITSCSISMVTALIITKGRVPSFIVTLGMQYILRSLCLFSMSGGGFYGDMKEFADISNYSIGGWLPLPIIYFFIMFAIYYYVSKHTILGRHIYAVGSNEKATRLSGINTDKIKILAHAMLGLAVAVASIIEASRMNSINATSSGTSYELNSIAITVVGGIAMEGGKGSMIGTFFGILILGIINNMLTLIGVNVYLVNAIKGAIIIFAVLLQRKEKDR